eukprot:gene10407-10565_t
MHKSASLFFDILTEDDESKRNEKIQRASFEIKTNAIAAGTPIASTALQQHTPVITGSSQQHGTVASDAIQKNLFAQDQQQQFGQGQDGSAADLGSQQQQEQDEQQRDSSAQRLQGWILTPQEVLQELLGDLYISQERLIMGNLLGQGGFADVHQAELVDPLLGFTEPVAVKRLRPDVLKGPDDLKEFLTEANLLRKLKHRNIVQLRGVGAADLSDLVAMRESMFVVQEYMAGGDLKAVVMAAMSRPFDPGYTKVQALDWAMQVAEAMHYLHCVCRPMIIHRDLKLDNILLTGGPIASSVAKLADFGLHKRVRKLVSSGSLVAWNQETTYHGNDFERSYYGGNLYLRRSAISTASSIIDENSVHSTSLNGSMHRNSAAAAALEPGKAAVPPLPPAWRASAAVPAATAVAASTINGSGSGSRKGLKSSSLRSKTAALDSSTSSPFPGQPLPTPFATCTASMAVPPSADDCNGNNGAAFTPSDSAASVHQTSRATSLPFANAGLLAGDDDADAPADAVGAAAAWTVQQQGLLDVVQAKSLGLLGKQDFVTHVLSAAAAAGSGVLQAKSIRHDKEVSRTFAAVQALEGLARESEPEITEVSETTQAAEACPYPATAADRDLAPASSGAPTQQDLCPDLLQQLHAGLAATRNSQKFIEATQKVGSLMYMSPEVLTGHQYNEKIDVFSFGIILYELLSGVVVAGRVAMEGEHEQLLDYARQVANGHREPLPPYWPASVKRLITDCWSQDPSRRPGFKEVMKRLYALKQAGVDVEMDRIRPKGNYNPVTDCGCCIM